MNFIGNHHIREQFEYAYKHKKIAHAYLFSGPEAVGKFLFAKKIAHILLDEQLCLSKAFDFFVDDIKMKAHPDIMILAPIKEEKKGITKEKKISIEVIRSAIKSITVSPVLGRQKIVIINNAHMLTHNAQNALLKTLEDPPKDRYIFLVTHKKYDILGTIQSRCQKIQFKEVVKHEMKEVCKSYEFRSSADYSLEDMYELASGKPGMIIKLLEDEDLFMHMVEQKKTLENLTNIDIIGRLVLAERLAKNIPEAIKTLDLWIHLLYQNIKIKNKSRLCIPLYHAIEKIQKTLYTLENTNTNARLVLENMLMTL